MDPSKGTGMHAIAFIDFFSAIRRSNPIWIYLIVLAHLELPESDLGHIRFLSRFSRVRFVADHSPEWDEKRLSTTSGMQKSDWESQKSCPNAAKIHG